MGSQQAQRTTGLEQKQEGNAPSAEAVELFTGSAVHKGVRVSWQEGGMAQASGTRAPGPPEKEQV